MTGRQEYDRTKDRQRILDEYMIDTAPCVMLLMRAASITWASGRGLGPGNLEFFGPQMALAYRLDAISQGPKNSQRGKVFFQSLLLKKNFEQAFQKDDFSATFTPLF